MICFNNRIGISLLVLSGILFFGSKARGQGTWAPVASTAPHYNSGEMMLMTDGTVLCKTSSGGTSYGTRWDKLTPDAHGSYINGTWTTIAPMANERLYFSSQVLVDGRLYIAGGEYGVGGNKGEVYDPLTNTWTGCPQIVYGHNISDANSELLANGKVLQAIVDTGGTKLNYIWDPTTNTYTHTASCLRGDNEAQWVKMPDGSILFIDNYGTTSERYIQATNTWINDGAVPDELYDPFGSEAGGAFMLPDGRAFFIGSTPTTAYYTPSGTTAPGTWTAGPAIPMSQGAPDAASSMMPNGNILLAISPTPISGDNFPDTTAYYEFDYLTNTFTQVNAPNGALTEDNPSFISNMLSLPDGTILYANQGDDQYYEYTPGSSPLAAGKPTLDSVIRMNCDTFMATGKLFNGITEGAAYGDDWQMATDYPILRFTSGTNVYYARSYGWNRIGAVMTGAALDTTMFVKPAGMPVGTYTIEVVANGNPSNTKTYNTAISVSPATAIACPGQTTAFAGVPAMSSFTWTTGNTAIATINPGTGILTGVAMGGTTVTYSGGSCFATASVVVNPAPAPITPAGGINLCFGSAISLSSATPGGTWSSGAPSIAAVGTTSGMVSTVSSGITIITYTAIGCTSVESISVNLLPMAAITASGPTAICPMGSGVALNATAGAGYGYQWYLGTSAIPGATDVAYSATTAGSYTVKVTNPAGCSATSVATAVTVGTLPVAAIATGGITGFCTGSSMVLNASSGVGLTYQWQMSGMNIAGATGAAYTATTGGSYNVIVTNGAGCSATSLATTIAVNPLPVSISGALTLCPAATTTLHDATGGGTWTSGSPTIATVASGTGVVTGVGTSGGVAMISYTLGTGCRATAPVTVNASTPASVGILASAGPVFCTVTSPVTFSAVPVNGGTAPTYQWLVNGLATSTAATFGYTPTGGDIVKCQMTSNASCALPLTASRSDTMIISPLRTPSVTISSAAVCAGYDATFFALPVYGGTAPTYVWSRNDTLVATGYAYVYTAHNDDVLKVTLTSNYACLAVDTAISPSVTLHPVSPVLNTINITVTQSSIVAGSVDTFVAIAPNGGTAPEFQWLKNGVAIAGATTSIYVTTTLMPGEVISCEETSSKPCATPATATSGGITVHVVAATGVESVVANGDNFIVIPNPNSGSFTIAGTIKNNTGEKATIVISDMLGQVVYKQTAAVNNGSLEQQVVLDKTVAAGMYLVSITSGQDHVVYHVVVEK